MLFCPPFPPIRLGGEAPASIGRHPSCELTLGEDDISRRHAEVRYEDAGYVLYDLKSTNGTFLNGELVEGSRRLSPGDRIGVGPETVTFCEVECTASPQWTDADGASTVVTEQPPDVRQGFLGDLSEIPPSALLQLLEMGSNSGVLEVDASDGSASIWFRSGRPTHAATEKLLGFDAAVAIVGMESGQFRFQPNDDEVDTTIQASVTELLLEACRLLDEEAAR